MFLYTNILKSPLDQFNIYNYITIDMLNVSISLTNIGLYLNITTYIIFILYIIADNNNILTPNNWSLSLESIYSTIYNIVINQINSNKGQMFFPFMSALFIYILINNLIGMVPYSFAPTSHFVLTFSISITIVLGATILALYIHNLKFFSLFVPKGCPLGLLPLLVLIEFISYLARNISLGLRLAANVLSGHLLLNILSSFTYNIMTSGVLYLLLGLIPLVFVISFSTLEIGIAFIQAQVFVVLSCSYIKDALDLH